jgi:hypothetical protein
VTDQPAHSPASTPPTADPSCACGKAQALCICNDEPALEHTTQILVLQHPQEQDKDLGTARLACRHLARATFRIGLSWPSLAKAFGQPADPAEWAVLHLGSAQASNLPKGREIVVLDRKGEALTDQSRALVGIKGVVIFDGTWSQAKTLWWRNPWVLKAKRLVIVPPSASLYGKLRREPRREGLSTLEAAGFVLSRLEQRPDIEIGLRTLFQRMLDRYRSVHPQGPPRTRRPFAARSQNRTRKPSPRRPSAPPSST